MKANLKVIAINKKEVTLSNGYIVMAIPKRSRLLNGNKIQKDERYEITLEKVV